MMALPHIEGGWQIVYADPAWKFSSNSAARPGKNCRRHYPTMTVEEVAAMPVREIVADQALLLLWITVPHEHRANEVISAWGFKPISRLVWDKGRIGTGYWARNQHEPCINASKSEIRAIAIRFPEAIERIEEWEAICAEASKRGCGTFFAADVTPEGAALAKQISRIEDPEARAAASAAAPWPTARRVAEWARTDRGGRQFNLLDAAFAEGEAMSCSSQYGLCE